MNIITIPTLLPDFTFTYRVGDNNIKFRCTWNDRDESWVLGMYRTDDTPLLLNSKLLQSQNLTSRYALPEFNNTAIYCVNTKAKQPRPVYEDLGVTLLLVHVLKDELALVAADPNVIAI